MAGCMHSATAELAEGPQGRGLGTSATPQGRHPFMVRSLAVGNECCQCILCGPLAASKPAL